ncbi:MAG: HNH endonuclease [Lactobacillus sp.]|nr:HNH endonuclease [Lactobacillus sp.]MCH4067968.1 HNH endonuclease [Lactobacillus sp.]MCI1399498.1 HNH endonuclease [Lactobacillus sp.]
MQLKQCRYPTCTKLVSRSQANPFCKDHAQYWQPPKSSPYRKTDYKMYNRFKRDKQADAFYHSKQWKRLSEKLRRKSIWTCQCCGRTRDRVSFLVVDHIVPLKVDPSRRLDEKNLWVLCKQCHFWKTQLETQIYGASRISNLDASKSWPREKIANWIQNKEKQDRESNSPPWVQPQREHTHRRQNFGKRE